MREFKFNKEPNLTGLQEVATNYGVYFLPTNKERAFPQKIAECTKEGAVETLDRVLDLLEKNGFNTRQLEEPDEYEISGVQEYDGKSELIEGELYVGSYMIVLNKPTSKAIERNFKIVRKPKNNNKNNGRGQKKSNR